MNNHHQCTDCSEPCTAIYADMGFSYSGTHCTYGQPGFHSDMRWISTCCSADIIEIIESEG